MDEPPATVLVVDDSDAKRYLLVSWLARAGFRVVQADSGRAALRVIDAGGIDLVVLDVRLGDMSGLDVCALIKANPRHAAVPVVHVSAHAIGTADRTLGLTGGADAYLAEPIDPDELVATTQAVLRYYRARQRAEQLAARLAHLADTTLALNSAATLGDLLAAAAAGTATIFDTGAVVMAESTEGERVVGRTAAAGAGITIERSPPGADDTARPGIETTTAAEAGATQWTPDLPVAVATARLRVDRPAVRVIVPATVLREGSAVLRQLALALAAAVEAQRSYDEEHDIALTLQRSFLPQRIPHLPGFDIAVRYEPASAQAEVGGDFYELAMIGGRLLAAIGDVAGHSLQAATVMAELRHAVRAYAVEGHPPGAVLFRVNELMHTLLAHETATICLLTLDPGTGEIRLANAGHLPPVLVTGGWAALVEHPAPLLGVRARRPDDLEFVLPAGGTLVLYTDGLVERRDVDLDRRLDALRASASTVESNLDGYCERLLTELSAPEMSDDIAVVVLRRH